MEVQNNLKKVKKNIEQLIIKGELNEKSKIQLQVMLESLVSETLKIQRRKVQDSLLNLTDII